MPCPKTLTIILTVQAAVHNPSKTALDNPPAICEISAPSIVGEPRSK